MQTTSLWLEQIWIKLEKLKRHTYAHWYYTILKNPADQAKIKEKVNGEISNSDHRDLKVEKVMQENGRHIL